MSSNTRHLVRGGGPARGRGRVRRSTWESLVFNGGLAPTSAVIDWVYAGKRQPRGGPYTRLRARLREIADPVARDRGRGRSWLWKLRPGHAPKGVLGWLTFFAQLIFIAPDNPTISMGQKLRYVRKT